MHIQSFYYYSDLTKKMDEIYYPFEILPERLQVVQVTIYINNNIGFVTIQRCMTEGAQAWFRKMFQYNGQINESTFKI